MKEGEPEAIYPTWQTYFAWEDSFTPERLRQGDKLGDWPQSTPPALIEIRKRIRGEDRIRIEFIGIPPPMQEVLGRKLPPIKSEEELEREREETRVKLEGVVDDVISRLTERERIVLLGRRGLIDGRIKTQAELARKIGRSTRTVGDLR